MDLESDFVPVYQDGNDYGIIDPIGWVRIGLDSFGGGTQMERSVIISQIEDRLRRLPPEKLGVVYDFISFLLDRDGAELLGTKDSDAFQTMLASEQVLRRDWNRPEEDAAWADL